MQVDNINDNNIELIRNFIKRVPTIKEIDEDVYMNNFNKVVETANNIIDG